MKSRDGTLKFPEFVARAEASNDATIQFSLGSAYNQYWVFCTDVRPASDGVNFRLRFSDDDGVSYYSTAGDYAFSSAAQTSTVLAVDSSSSAAQIRLNTPQVGNAFGEGWSGAILITSLGGTKYATVQYQGIHQDATSNPESSTGVGQLIVNTNKITNIQFDFSSGNIASGKFALYGITNR